jgi:hypothetical protein
MATSGKDDVGRATVILDKREYSRFPTGTKVITLRTKDGAETTATLKGESIIGIAVELSSEFALARHDVVDVVHGENAHRAIIRRVELRAGKPFVRLDWLLDLRQR